MSLIFQAIPDRYDLRTRFKEGARVHWAASRYRDHMVPGEIVYFWLAGDRSHRGLYGWGTIGRAPHSQPDSGYRVEVLYRHSFLQHSPRTCVPSHELSKAPRLSDHLLFRMPMGTNFLLNAEEDQAVRDAIERTLGADHLPPDKGS